MPRICPDCGSIIDDDMRFCVKCGKPVDQTVNEPVRYPAEIVERGGTSRKRSRSYTDDYSPGQTGKRRRKVPVWIIILPVLLIAGGVAAYYFMFSNTVNLNKYVDISFEGTDGEGTARAEFDTSAFISDYGTKIQYKTGVDWLDQAATLLSTPAALLKDSCINGSLDKTSGLSNGDEVVYAWNCDDMTADKYFDVKLKYSDIKVKVKGLSERDSEGALPEESLTKDDTPRDPSGEEPADTVPSTQPGNVPTDQPDDTPPAKAGGDPAFDTPPAKTDDPVSNSSANNTSDSNGSSNLKDLDPFANIEIQYDGVSPFLKVSVNDGHAETAVQQHVTFSVMEGTEYVACGQAFTLRAEFEPERLKEEGFQITTLEKQYTVPDSLPRFLSGEEESDLSRVRSNLHDYLEAHASEAVGQGGFWNRYDMDFVNHAQIGIDGLYNPEITKIDSVTEIKRYWMNKKTQYDEADSIHNRYAVLYKIEISARGYKTNNDSVDFKRTAYSLVSAENIYTTEDGVSWAGTNGLGGENIVCHSQMDEKDQLLSKWMTSYKDEYNVTESEP